MALIEVNHVSKEFRLGEPVNLRRSLQRAISRLGGNPLPTRPHFKALEDVDFKVEAGEVLGIIGGNGAGKSTLLKILAGISQPTAGSVRVSGRLAPLIEVGAGLIGDLSGRENIYLNGIILGMRYRQIRQRIDEIVEFAELEEFIDTPIKRYSSGMAVRLGFSIATSVDADILIVDEVLAVGDLAFQRKCFDRMEHMIKRQGKTVLLVSHNLRQVERLCDRVILLERGHMVEDGLPANVCESFYKRSDEKVQKVAATSPAKWTNTQECEDLELISINLMDEGQERETRILQHGGSFVVRIEVLVRNELRLPTFGFGVHTTDLLYLTTQNSEQQVQLDQLLPGQYVITCRVHDCPLVPGTYALRLGISDGVAGARIVFYGENLLYFQVVNNPARHLSEANLHGFFALDATWAAPKLQAANVSSRDELVTG